MTRANRLVSWYRRRQRPLSDVPGGEARGRAARISICAAGLCATALACVVVLSAMEQRTVAAHQRTDATADATAHAPAGVATDVAGNAARPHVPRAKSGQRQAARARGAQRAESRRPRLAIIYDGGETTGPNELRRAIAPEEADLTIFAPGDGGLPLTAETDLTMFDLLLVDGAAAAAREQAARIGAIAAAGRGADGTPRVVVLNGAPGGVVGNVPSDAHPWLPIYWQNPSQDNYAALVRYLVRRLLDRPPTPRPVSSSTATSPAATAISGATAAAAATAATAATAVMADSHAEATGGAVASDRRDDVPPPIVYPAQGFYHPDAAALFPSLDAYLAWYRAPRAASAAHVYDPAKLTVGIYVHVIPYQQKNIAQIDALVRAVEQRGQNAIVLTTRGSPAIGQALAPGGRAIVDVLLFTGERLNLKDRAAGLAEARALGVPVLSALQQHAVDAAGFAALPNGLHPALTPIIVNAERDGLFEPIVISAKSAPRDGRTFIDPLPAQIAWRVDRALAWAKLHRAATANKRIVFTYWSEGGGKANAGGDPDDFLDVPASLVRLLAALRARGYDLGDAPLPDRDALTRRMALESSNVGNWAPAELARRVAAGHAALVPEETYKAWFDALPPRLRDEIVEMWGPPPGDIMVHTAADGRRYLVIPRLQFGNILIAPHPDWGQLQNARALLASGALPPHHQYLAFFLWLQRDWRADAWVSLFSNIVLQPGKGGGPAADDPVALLLGALPHIHPERLGSNGGMSNKRKGMALTPGWFNIVVPSDATEPLADLRALVSRLATQEPGPLRDEAVARLRAEVTRTGVARALGGGDLSAMPVDALVRGVEAHLDDLDRAQMPLGTKVLGDAPSGRVLADMVTGMLGTELRQALARLDADGGVGLAAAAPTRTERTTRTTRETARLVVSDIVTEGLAPRAALIARTGRTSEEAEALLARAPDYAARLRGAPREVESILDALDGRWIEPGPMNSPLRQPDAVPPGRVLYAFDQAAYPTPEAEALGVRQAEALIAAHRAQHDGAWPSRLALVLWSGETARTQGVAEAQILHLLGTRAVRNAQGEVTGVELIPREALGRPRVDVLATMSGTYRDNYQDKVALITQAARLAAASPEADNPIGAATRAEAARLTAAGEAPERARVLAGARLFAPAPGAYSPGIQFLARAGDARGDAARMADLFTSRMSHAYADDLFGVPARATFEQGLARVDAAALPRSGEVNGMLDHPMSAGFLGGLNLAAHALTGRDLDLYVSRTTEADGASIQSAASAIQTELRSRYLNPRWLSAMTQHGYDGARNLMFMTAQLDLWDSTAAGTVSSADWAEVKAVYVDDRHGLDLDRFFDRYNPHAQQMVLADLLGAASRGQWQASAQDLAQVAGRLARSAAAHGAVCEAAMCRNPALTTQVSEALAATADGAALASAYRDAIDRARGEHGDLEAARSTARRSDAGGSEAEPSEREPSETERASSAETPAGAAAAGATAAAAAPAEASSAAVDAAVKTLPSSSDAASRPSRATGAPSLDVSRGPSPSLSPRSSPPAALPRTPPMPMRMPSPSQRAPVDARAGAPRAAGSRAASAVAAAPSQARRTTVTGRVLEQVARPAMATTMPPPRGWLWWGLGGVALLLFACGWTRRPG